MALKLRGSRALALSVFFALLLAACGDERPESTDALSAMALAPSVGASPASDALPSSVVVGPCTPGAWVPCHVYYRDLDGRLQCPMSLALCRPDGKETYECGAWVDTADGPRPRDAGTDVEVVNE